MNSGGSQKVNKPTNNISYSKFVSGCKLAKKIELRQKVVLNIISQAFSAFTLGFNHQLIFFVEHFHFIVRLFVRNFTNHLFELFVRECYFFSFLL